MMMSRLEKPFLIDRLPRVRGRYTVNGDIARFLWFRVGGPAEVLFEPADANDLASFLREKPTGIPVTVIGAGSNLLVRDGGIDGVVVHLGRPFTEISVEDTKITAGAAAMDVRVARAARDAGIGGLEFLSGIPGTIGGALRMNAGAYGREVANVLVRATALDERGGRQEVSAEEFDFSYRRTGVPEGWIFVSCVLQGTPDDIAAIRARMSDIGETRLSTQPVKSRTGGSTFANPEGAKAWELIDRAGCRGLRIGAAAVSEQHCNFLINTGGATAADLEALGEEVRRRVRETMGVELDWEIRRIGRPLAGANDNGEGEQ